MDNHPVFLRQVPAYERLIFMRKWCYIGGQLLKRELTIAGSTVLGYIYVMESGHFFLRLAVLKPKKNGLINTKVQ